jgi:hypothetical protein
MKVYSFTSQKTKPKENQPKFFSFGKSNYSGHKKNIPNRRTEFNPFKFLENKNTSQILAVLALTIAVFIAVQGLFGSTPADTASAAGLDDSLKLIINYNANSVDTTNTDNSKVVDAVDPAPVTTPADSTLTASNNNTTKVQNLNSTKTPSQPALNKK